MAQKVMFLSLSMQQLIETGITGLSQNIQKRVDCTQKWRMF